MLSSGRQTGPWSSWLPGPDLCGAASYWLVGWVLGWLAEEPQEAPGPVCPTGGVKTGSEVSGCGARPSVSLLVGGWAHFLTRLTACSGVS